MDCVFCNIVAGKIPSKKVYENETAVAFLDINPRNPGHTLVIPKKHYQTILDMPDDEAGRLFEVVKKVAVAAKKGTEAEGISIVQSNGPAAGQIVPHVHFHVIPRFRNEGPIGLESVLPNKRMDETTMDKIAESIKSGFVQQKESGEVENTEESKEDEEINFDF